MMANPAAPKPLTFALLRLLSDGEFHSGEALAQHLQISRSWVNDALHDIEEFGLQLYRVRGRGYRLVEPPVWLDDSLIRHHLGKDSGKFAIEILDSAPSSNTLLLQRAAQQAPSGSVLAVEWQSAGRGRLGRPWLSGLGNALTFSLLWRFEQGIASLSGLSLVIGLALIRTLRALGTDKVRLKWPNDLLDEQGNKLGGILIEAQGDMLGPALTVLGIGLNVSLPPRLARQIDQPASCLANVLGYVPDRNLLLALALREIGVVLHEFAVSGFPGMRQEWEACHTHQDQSARLLLPNGAVMEGTVRGVTEEGALRLETQTGMHILHAGEISLRDHAADRLRQ